MEYEEYALNVVYFVFPGWRTDHKGIPGKNRRTESTVGDATV